MKTREEIAKELEDKRKKELAEIQQTALSKEKEEIKAILSAFMTHLKSHRPIIEQKVIVSDFEVLKSLKSQINSLNERLQDIRIPEEVKVIEEKTVTHKTDKVSHQFLLWFFVVAFAIIFGLLWYAIDLHYSTADKIEKAETRGRDKGHKDIYRVLPQQGKKWLKKEYPDVEWEETKNE